MSCADALRILVQLKSALEAAMRALERQQRPEDADALAVAIADTEASDSAAELLAETLKSAQQKAAAWRALAASEAKLQRALADGASTQALSRAIQEATAAGVKVAAAKRTLKVRLAFCARRSQSKLASVPRCHAQRSPACEDQDHDTLLVTSQLCHCRCFRASRRRSRK
jgi:hypothetical protein